MARCALGRLLAVTALFALACSEQRLQRGDGGETEDLDASESSAADGAPMNDAGPFAVDGGHGDDAARDAALQACTSSTLSTQPSQLSAPRADPARSAPRRYFELAIETQDGMPVRGATVRSVGKVVYVSDDHGKVAFDEPGQTDMPVYFHVEHAGFEAKADAFGYRGAQLRVSEGGRGRIELVATSGAQGPSTGDLASRLLTRPIPGKAECVAIRAVDMESGRGVPLVRLRAFDEDYYSDSQGMVAYCHPDHLGGEIRFEVKSHGYVLASGETSVTLAAQAGADRSVPMRRLLAAERLYRLTGSGIYRDSVILGLTTPTEHPVLNGQVIGSDTVDSTLFEGKLFWLWQDTDRVSYPLGNFRGTAAVSALPAQGGLPVGHGVNFEYFVGADGFARGIGEAFEPNGPVWMAGLISVPDASGKEQLFASYAKVDGNGSPLEAGLMRWNRSEAVFERVVRDYASLPAGFVRPDGYAFKFVSGDGTHVYYPGRLRVPASAEAMIDRARYELFTARDKNGALVRDTEDASRLDWAFRSGAPATERSVLQNAGVAASQDLSGHLREYASGRSLDLIQTHSAFNPHRRRFVRQAQQMGAWGELFHAEADTPMGPWAYAEKVVTHDAYTFYNPSLHPELDEGGGRFLHFEATYTTFLQPTPPTPRYDYNQVLYRLDLDDPRVILPVPVYDLGADVPGRELALKEGLRPGMSRLAAPFMALDRPRQGALGLGWSAAACANTRRLEPMNDAAGALFYALPASDTSPQTLPLYAYQDAMGRTVYSTRAELALSGFTRQKEPLARVWENPVQVALPVADYLGDLIAEAGPDQCVSGAGAGTASVRLSASGTRAGAHHVVAYRWTIGDTVLCGAEVELALPLGTHAVELQVETSTGLRSRDRLLVTVAP